MNYYPFHLGDYAAHTGHLEPMEDLAYRRLLDVYYMREGALPADIQVTSKLVRMRSMSGDVEAVLNEFFTLTPAGWVHARCESEIEAMQERQNVAKAKANKRWHKPVAEPSIAESRTQHMQEEEHSNATAPKNNAAAYPAADATAQKKDADAMLPTPTQTPIKNTATQSIAPPDGVSISVWQDFQKLRKTKKAPLTETSLAVIKREAEKAGWSVDAALQECCARGWQSFKADWVVAKQSAPESMFAGAI